MYDSKLSGEDWVQELLHGHPGQFCDNLGMSKHVIQKLVQELQMYAGLYDSQHIMKEEQVAIFLHSGLCRTGNATCDIRERFQHSANTIGCFKHLQLDLQLMPQLNPNSTPTQI